MLKDKEFRYRLGLDLGTNSLGWAILELDKDNNPIHVSRLGVRIFDSGRSPKDGTSKAVDRRGPRQMRRRLDRYLRRRSRFINALVKHGLMPETEAERQKLLSLNPWRLRSEAIEKKLELSEIGRALFHLQQRRGFKSNRKVDKAADEKETAGMKGAINEFASVLNGKTVGQELYRRIQKGEPGRARKIGSGQTERYAFYVDRAMVAAEFDAIWALQAKYHPKQMTDAAKTELRDILLYQRNLLPQTPGKCFYERSESRMPMAYESAQLFRLYQDVNNLQLERNGSFEKRSLTRQERDQIIEMLLETKEKKLASIRKELLGKAEADNWHFTVEETSTGRGKRDVMKGNQTRSVLAKPGLFGDSWDALDLDKRDEIAEMLIKEENERLLIEKLMNNYGLDENRATAVAQVSLPDAYLRISQKAGQKILDQLQNNWNAETDSALTYDKAVLAAGYKSHSQGGTGEVFDTLPYYGEILYQYTAPIKKTKNTNPDEVLFGKIGNPTVHLGLNQVRKIVNAIIKRYGKPTQIVVEVARELKNGEYTKNQIDSANKENRERNQRIDKELEALGVRVNAENRLRLKLYEELGSAIKQCVYTGKTISKAELFSNAYQVDHILPLSKTLDDGYMNKVLVTHDSNRFKGNKSPYEAFGSSPNGYNWDEILDRALRLLPPAKRRKFSPDAESRVDDWLARQITDTQYLARVTLQYLRTLHEVDVWNTPGRLTGLMRGKWNLNDLISINGEKNREDHRHHAIDAAVIAVTERSTLQKISRAAASAEKNDLDRSFDTIEEPFPSFRHEMAEKVARIVVSHKPEHGIEGALHNDTAYGIDVMGAPGSPSLVHHKVAVTSLSESDLGNMKAPYEHLTILDADKNFLKKLEVAIYSSDKPKEIEAALQELADKTGRKSVSKREVLTVIPIFQRGKNAEAGDKPYKAVKGDGNYCYEIFETPDGKWDGEIITRFAANTNEYREYSKSKNFFKKTFSGKPLVMRIQINDTVQLDSPMQNQPIIYRVQLVSTAFIVLAAINESNVDARIRSKSIVDFVRKTPSSLRATNAKKVFVDELGSVITPK